MGDLTLRHHQHDSYQSAMASGLVLHGPTADGFVHILFYRDGAKILEENFTTEEQVVNGVQQFRIIGEKEPAKVEHFREDVATILIPIGTLPAVADSLARMVELLRQTGALKAAEKTAAGSVAG